MADPVGRSPLEEAQGMRRITFGLSFLASFVGMRAAECCGLRVQDLNLAKGVAIIRVTNSEVGGKLYLQEDPKNLRIREFPLADWMCRILDEHIARYPSEEGFVFTSTKGKPLRWRNFYGRHFKPAVLAAGIDPTFEFRWLRDTAISNGRHLAGQPTKVMQVVVGHSSEAMTQDVYSHLPADAMDNLKQAWQQIFEETAEETGFDFAARLLHEDDSRIAALGARTYVPVADLRQ